MSETLLAAAFYLSLGFIFGALIRSWWMLPGVVLLWIAWVVIGLATARFDDKNELTPTALVAVATLFMFVPALIGAGLGVIVGRRIARRDGTQSPERA